MINNKIYLWHSNHMWCVRLPSIIRFNVKFVSMQFVCIYLKFFNFWLLLFLLVHLLLVFYFEWYSIRRPIYATPFLLLNVDGFDWDFVWCRSYTDIHMHAHETATTSVAATTTTHKLFGEMLGTLYTWKNFTTCNEMYECKATAKTIYMLLGLDV